MAKIQYKITETFEKDVSTCKRLFCKVVPKIVELLVFIGDENNPKAVARLVYNLSEGNISLVWFSVNKEKYPELKGIGKTILCNGIDLLYNKYLLDEPTVGMDVQTRTSMMEHLRELNQDKKMTILYTSHYLEQAELFCNRVAIIDHGQLLCLGSPIDLIKKENGNDLEDVFLKFTGRKIRD